MRLSANRGCCRIAFDQRGFGHYLDTRGAARLRAHCSASSVRSASSSRRETEGVIFRAAREAVQNAVEHARPASIAIRLVEGDGVIKLWVRDDGAGFDVDSELRRPRSGHIGLNLIADLASEAGGVTRIESEPGGGT